MLEPVRLTEQTAASWQVDAVVHRHAAVSPTKVICLTYLCMLPLCHAVSAARSMLLLAGSCPLGVRQLARACCVALSAVVGACVFLPTPAVLHSLRWLAHAFFSQHHLLTLRQAACYAPESAGASAHACAGYFCTARLTLGYACALRQFVHLFPCRAPRL